MGIITVIQFNDDRCKAHNMILAEKEFVQEPYNKHEDSGKFRIQKRNDRAKAESWTKRELKPNTIQELTDTDLVTITLHGQGVT